MMPVSLVEYSGILLPVSVLETEKPRFDQYVQAFELILVESTIFSILILILDVQLDDCQLRELAILPALVHEVTKEAAYHYRYQFHLSFMLSYFRFPWPNLLIERCFVVWTPRKGSPVCFLAA